MSKIEVTEVKTYRCSDGKIYDSKEMAEAHEIELKDPNYAIEKRIAELERKFLELQGELAKITAKSERPEFPWRKNPWLDQNKDCVPFSQPYNGKIWYGTGQNLTEAINNLKEVIE